MIVMLCSICITSCFFFNDTATTEIYTDGHTLSLHDALPIYAEQAELSGQVAEVVELLLHGVADEHQGRDLPLPRFLGRALQHLADLGAPGETEHTSHEAQQLSRFGNPRTRPALAEAAVVDEIGRASCRERVCKYVSISVVAVT